MSAASSETAALAGQIWVWMAYAAPLVAAIGLAGAAVALVRRRFAGTSFAIGLSTMGLALAISPVALAIAVRAPVTGLREIVIWGGAAAVAAFAGALVGVVERRVGFWESYLTTIFLAGAGLAVHFLFAEPTQSALGQATLLAVVSVSFAFAGGFLAKKYFERGLIWWVLHQVGQLLWLIVYVLVVGLVLAILERRFRWDGWVAGLALMVGGISIVGAAVYLAPEALFLWRDYVIWGGSMSAMLLGGFLCGKLARRLTYWECYLAALVITFVVFVHLGKGWHVVLGLGPSDTQSHFEFLISVPPGLEVFGSMWARTVGFGCLVGFLLSVFGASLAYLFFSEEGRLDIRFTFESLIGVRHLLTRKHGPVSVTAVVAVFGVSLGVASLVAVTAVMSGYQEDIKTKILNTNAHFVIQKYGIDFVEHEETAAEVLADPEVLAATPFTFNEAMLATADRGIGVLIKGVVPEEAGTVTGVEGNLCRKIERDGTCIKYATHDQLHLPELLSKRDKLPTVIVGSELFKKLDQPVGSLVTLTTPVGIAGARGNAPKRLQFRLAGAFRSGMHDFDVRLMYLDLESSQRLMGLGQAVNGVEFKVRDPDRVELVAERALDTVGRYPYRTLDWRELNIGIFTALKLQKIVMFLVLTFIIIVAAFNIASTLFMAVVEKAREIAVLKSMGSCDTSIMKIFVLEGWIVGGMGTAVGLILGLLVCVILSQAEIPIAADVYMVESLQVRVRPLEIGLTAAATMVISHLATLYPALKAARQRPVDAMRYE